MGAFDSLRFMSKKTSSHSAVHLKRFRSLFGMNGAEGTQCGHSLAQIHDSNQQSPEMLSADPHHRHRPFLMTLTFSGSVDMPSRDTTRPNTTTSSCKNVHFFGLIFRPASLKGGELSDSLSLCSCSVRPKIIMSSRYSRQSDQH